MFDSIDDEFAALVACIPDLPSDSPEPDWSEHPVYAELVPAAERLIQLLDLLVAEFEALTLARAADQTVAQLRQAAR
ncbi:MAG TPA: hypothetical protein VGX49_15960, partial [Jatrophihabitans sp.]|nr:hypothetical protein [Jatrophihabitans sp.]